MNNEDKELIVSALAFAASSDIIAKFTPEQEARLGELAVEFKEEYELNSVSMVELPYRNQQEIEKYADNYEAVSRFLEFVKFS